jgi:hypothetical protein
MPCPPGPENLPHPRLPHTTLLDNHGVLPFESRHARSISGSYNLATHLVPNGLGAGDRTCFDTAKAAARDRGYKSRTFRAVACIHDVELPRPIHHTRSAQHASVRVLVLDTSCPRTRSYAALFFGAPRFRHTPEAILNCYSYTYIDHDKALWHGSALVVLAGDTSFPPTLLLDAADERVQPLALLSERGSTFWRFSLEVQLEEKEKKVGYRISGGTLERELEHAFWVPGKDDSMRIMCVPSPTCSRVTFADIVRTGSVRVTDTTTRRTRMTLLGRSSGRTS